MLFGIKYRKILVVLASIDTRTILSLYLHAITDAFDHNLRACSMTADRPLIRKGQISQTCARVHGSLSMVDRMGGQGYPGWVVNMPVVNYCSSKHRPFA